MRSKELIRQHTFVSIDEQGVEDRITRIKARSIKNEAKREGLRLVLSMIDLTTLEGEDTQRKVQDLCYKAIHLNHSAKDLPSVAAVCVYPPFVQIAKKALAGSGVRVASVSTYFPSGQASLDFKLKETLQAIDSGADEIDMVVSRGRFLAGDYTYVLDEILVVKSLCLKANVRLKVILETGELGSLEEVRRAADIALLANPDFIKTSTGKISNAANLSVTLVMLEAIRDHYLKTGVRVGMKPAGGISDSKTALQYLTMVKEVLGQDWLTNEWLRIGASSLLNDVLMQIRRQDEGTYQSPNYFS